MGDDRVDRDSSCRGLYLNGGCAWAKDRTTFWRKKSSYSGIGSFAEVANYYFTHDSDYSAAAFTVDAAYLKEPTFQGFRLWRSTR